METFVDDLLELFEHLNIKDAMMVGHSHGGGEVARFLGKHGTSRVKKAVLVGAVPPLMLKTTANADGTDKSVSILLEKLCTKIVLSSFWMFRVGPSSDLTDLVRKRARVKFEAGGNRV